MGVFDKIINVILDDFSLTYTHVYAYRIAFNFAFLASLFFIIACLTDRIFNKTSKILEKKAISQIELQPMQSQPDQSAEILLPMAPSSDLVSLNSFHIRCKKAFKLLSGSLYSIAFLLGGLAPCILSGVDIIAVSSTILMILLYFSLIFIFISVKADVVTQSEKLNHESPTVFPRNLLKIGAFEKVISFRRAYPYITLAYAVCSLLYSTFVPLSTAGLCMAFYTKAGFQYGPFSVSTYFTRRMFSNNACADGQVCHIYSTLPEDPSTAVILNVHTGQDVKSINILYRQAIDNSTKERSFNLKTAQSFYLDFEQRAARYVHSAYLSGLQPATEYYFQIFYNDKVQGESYFKTLPDVNMENNMTIVLGGDVGATEKAEKIVKQLDTKKPDVILLGGDLAYDNGNEYCWQAYDSFLEMFEGLNTRLNKLVPLVLTFGNHDAGQNELQFIPINKERNLYFFYFPQHSKINDQRLIVGEVPPVNERETYFYHKLGNTLHITLDSGYMHSYDGPQLDWLVNVSKTHQNLPKYANYHLPIVPACYFGGIYKTDDRINSWAPVFETYRFAGAFEHHVHLYKRTFPIKFANSSKHGVVYFGDGSWGANAENCYEKDNNKNVTGVFASLGNSNHAWVMKIQNNQAKIFAINSDGKSIDNVYAQKLEKFKIKEVQAEKIVTLNV